MTKYEVLVIALKQLNHKSIMSEAENLAGKNTNFIKIWE